MNPVIKNLVEHYSERSFLNKAIPDEVLDRIIETAYRAPTSVNSQQVSVIVSRDAEARKKIAELAGGQPWIAQAPVFLTLVLDMYKTQQGMALNGEQQIAHNSVESLISGSTDVGIALASIMSAARSEGLGIVPIGGIRRDPEAIVHLLDLPEHTFPVAGVVIGYVDRPSERKPRLPMQTFRHEESYQREGLENHIQHYNDRLMQHWQSVGRGEGLNWSESMGAYYKNIYYPAVCPALLKQGFKFDK
ncbi:nitroreductase family protein [Pantoea sp. FN060301]|uniref:nitroreductase family protein n=1 Tax=Pantoea sp. FN060301 TaxID=3420380 RepID=UPI003D182868